jgi:hypothetical protein
MAINLEGKLNLRGNGFPWLSIKAVYRNRLVKEVDYNYIILD